MKSKFSLLTIAGLVAVSITAWAENAAPASDATEKKADQAAVEAPAAKAADAATATAATPAQAETAAPAASASAPSADGKDAAAAAPAPGVTTEPTAAAPVAAAESAKPAEPEKAAEAKAETTTAPTAPLIAANDATQPAATPTATDSSVTNTTSSATDTNATTTAAAVAPAPAAAVAPTAAPAPAGPAIIPLIVMDDVPLTDAIKNLARQAGLNYMLDPKIGFGQPGPNGQPAPQPSVSIRWENVTAEQALNALLNNYSLQMMEDPRTKIARITIKDPAAPDPLVTKIFQLRFANPSNIVAAVQNTLVDKRSKVVADIRTSQLVALATQRELNDVDTLIARLDTVTKQVLIEAKLLETSMNPSTSKGLDWSGTFQAQHLAFGNNLQQNSANASINSTLSQTFPRALFDTAKGFNPATAFLDADGVAAVFSFLNKDANAKVISAPRTVTLDNEPARIEVTRASPIINITPGTVQVSGGSQITYTNLGIVLNVTPRISANNYVNLKVTPEVSRIFDTITRVVNGGEFQADEYDVRKMDTRVMIPSGNTLVLGGLVQDDVRDSATKVPVLGDVPLLGAAFRSNTKTRQKSNLIIFITPTIVEEDDYQKTTTDYLKTPVPTTDSLEGPWSRWNTAVPMDWSKPAAMNDAVTPNQAPTEK